MPYGRRNFAAYQRTGISPGVNATFPSARSGANYRKKAIVVVVITTLYTAFLYSKGGASTYLGTVPDKEFVKSTKAGFESMLSSGRRLTVATWNIAAINNNPFEYWITYDADPTYEKLMGKIEEFIENPGDKDVPVSKVFTEPMFEKLDKRLTDVGWTSARKYWDSSFKDRKIVSGFMKDEDLGLKRLASMPDRYTNTINLENGDQVFRPTVINMYDGDLSTMDLWWAAWERFMFDDKIKIKDKTGAVVDKVPYQLLSKIKKEKYPAVTDDEEENSLPLQTMCGAIFDAILVHMMNTLADSPEKWQSLKKAMVESLNKQKVSRTLSILEEKYADADIITLQEVSLSLIEKARAGKLGQKFTIVAPEKLDASRDQNSVILLSKETFPNGKGDEISSLVEKAFPEGKDVPVADGDILAITAKSNHGVPFVIASFHGDTNGLATIPVLDALQKAMNADDKLIVHKLIFGMDANTYEMAKDKKKQQDVMEFGKKFVSHGLTSCWGDKPQAGNYTTFNARTYLQPQLNKACKRAEKRSKGDVNPKDFILFSKKDFAVVKTWKDNTGNKVYHEDMPFPTLTFPSDHGILATVLEPKK